MKKLSQINETSWGGMVKRSSGESVRKEKSNNIKEMKTVDLSPDCPVYIADIDYEEGGINHFTFKEAMEINKKIQNSGWRLPYGDIEICDIFFKDDHLPGELKDSLKQDKNLNEFWVSITSIETNETVVFPLEDNKYGIAEGRYWCNWEIQKKYRDFNPDECNNARVFSVGDPKLNFGNVIGTNNYDKNRLCKIRLVKDK